MPILEGYAQCSRTLYLPFRYHHSLVSVALYVGCADVHSTNMLGYEGMKEMFYLTTHSIHFIYGFMASGIW